MSSRPQYSAANWLFGWTFILANEGVRAIGNFFGRIFLGGHELGARLMPFFNYAKDDAINTYNAFIHACPMEMTEEKMADSHSLHNRLRRAGLRQERRNQVNLPLNAALGSLRYLKYWLALFFVVGIHVTDSKQVYETPLEMTWLRARAAWAGDGFTSNKILLFAEDHNYNDTAFLVDGRVARKVFGQTEEGNAPQFLAKIGDLGVKPLLIIPNTDSNGFENAGIFSGAGKEAVVPVVDEVIDLGLPKGAPRTLAHAVRVNQPARHKGNQNLYFLTTSEYLKRQPELELIGFAPFTADQLAGRVQRPATDVASLADILKRRAEAEEQDMREMASLSGKHSLEYKLSQMNHLERVWFYASAQVEAAYWDYREWRANPEAYKARKARAERYAKERDEREASEAAAKATAKSVSVN